MAIFGPVDELHDQWPLGRQWEVARGIVLRYLAEGSEQREQAFSREEGESIKIDIDDDLFLIEEAYLTSDPGDVRWEAHREWADVQVILDGEERMDVVSVGNLELVEDLSPQRDMLYFEDYKKGTVLRLEAGDAAIYFPVDGHRPGLQIGSPSLVRKLVVKVRL